MRDRPIEVLHVGSASRDLTDDDPRGWRLGGGVTYAALTTARLGLRTAAVVGADAPAASADELDLLRGAGVSVRVVALDESPVFRNMEAAGGRIQACLAVGQRLPVVELPAAWRAAPAWSLVPVAGEIGDDWASAVPERASLTVGWQGWLRALAAGSDVVRRPPAAAAPLRRADLVGVSRHDLEAGTRPAALRSWLRPDASLLVTDGERGGVLLERDSDGVDRSWRYAAIAADVEVDPTGAGDAFLAALLASVVRPVTRSADAPSVDLRTAAAVASLTIERAGLLGIPDRGAVIERARRGRPPWRDPVD